jgi:hypothetical protein
VAEFNVESQYGRFVGAQFDVNRSPQYQEEIVLVVRAKVTEKVFRTASSGMTREISVLKPEEVFVADGAQEMSLRKAFGMQPTLTTPSLGTPVELILGTPVEENQIHVEGGFVPVGNPSGFGELVGENERPLKKTEDRPGQDIAKSSAPNRIPPPKDKILARFLSSVGED